MNLIQEIDLDAIGNGHWKPLNLSITPAKCVKRNNPLNKKTCIPSDGFMKTIPNLNTTKVDHKPSLKKNPPNRQQQCPFSKQQRSLSFKQISQALSGMTIRSCTTM